MKNWKLLLGGAALLLVGATAAATFAAPAAGAATITVYKSPTCGCCVQWVEHLRAEGFTVETVDVVDISAVKQEYGVGPENASCHTAIVDGYVVEGHVPADLIAKMLEQRPEITGLAVPGMPMGSPGMEGPRKDAYDVFAFRVGQGRSVYASR